MLLFEDAVVAGEIIKVGIDLRSACRKERSEQIRRHSLILSTAFVLVSRCLPLLGESPGRQGKQPIANQQSDSDMFGDLVGLPARYSCLPWRLCGCSYDETYDLATLYDPMVPVRLLSPMHSLAVVEFFDARSFSVPMPVMRADSCAIEVLRHDDFVGEVSRTPAMTFEQIRLLMMYLDHMPSWRRV